MIIGLYIVVFWILLPGGLGLLSVAGGGPIAFHPGRIGWLAPLFVGIIVFYRGTSELRTVGDGLPISALPPLHLVETGPYAVVRHPLYIGYQLIVLSVSAMLIEGFRPLLVFGVMLLIGWLVYAVIEERGLIRRYGSAYLRYRNETPLLIPRLTTVARTAVVIVARLWFGLRVRGVREVPRSGPVVFVAIHRCYFDPFFIAASVDRHIHFLTTESMFRSQPVSGIFRALGGIPLRRYRSDLGAIRTARSILSSGGAVGIFPDGGRSWYGETACDPTVYRLLSGFARDGASIIFVDIEGAFGAYPRVGKRVLRRRITVRFERHQGVVRDGIINLAERARNRDRIAMHAPYRLRTEASYFEALFPVCPVCKAGFSVRGLRNDRGLLRCDSCGAGWRITDANGVVTIGSSNPPVPLIDFEPFMARQLMTFARVSVPALECRLGGDSIRNPAVRVDAGTIDLYAHGVPDHDDPAARRPSFLSIPHRSIDAVVIEGRSRLEIYADLGHGVIERVELLMEPRYTPGIQYLLRTRAFGSPYIRVRGTERGPVGV